MEVDTLNKIEELVKEANRVEVVNVPGEPPHVYYLRTGERFGEYYAANDYDVRLVKRDEDGEVVEVHCDPLADYRHQRLTDQKELETKRAKLATEVDYGDL